MNNPNIGLLFYKHYFEGLEPSNSDGEISFKLPQLGQVTNTILNENQIFDNKREYANKIIELKFSYPGLLIGSGYNHAVGGTKEELKLGFFFDHTTGLPCIPGSSVKGMLRSVFPFQNRKKKSDKENKIFREPRVGYLNELFSSIGIPELNYEQIKKLELEIFEGKRKVDDKLQYISIYKRDTFFDAFPFEMTDKLFYDDYITPHIYKEKPELSALKNPIPIRFLKVAPEVNFRFEIKIFKSEIVPTITKEIKKQLFSAILKDFGIGAKTNVGYGQFEN